MRDMFFRVAAISPRVSLADCKANSEEIIRLASEADAKGVDLAVTPEFSLTGYTCGDLFHSRELLDSSNMHLAEVAEATGAMSLTLIVGAPILYNNVLLDCGVVLQGGKVRMIVPKTYIPNYGEFYEKRWWHGADCLTYGNVTLLPGRMENVPIGTNLLCQIGNVKTGIEICEDMWTPIPPSSRLAMAGAHVIANLSASDSVVGKYQYLNSLISQQSARTISGYVYASAGYGESTTDLVFDGKTIIAENGNILARNERWKRESQMVIADIDIEAIEHDRMVKNSFADCAVHEHAEDYHVIEVEMRKKCCDGSEIMRKINPTPFIPMSDDMDATCSEVINIQCAALGRRLDATHCRNIVVGISGGLDSTLALMVACRTFDMLGLDRKGIHGITMPGFGTTGRTHSNAVDLMESLGVSIREISIVPAVTQHFTDIGHNPEVHDVTYENSQARQRTYLLMDIANQVNGMVLGTGDMSELALGWATYNGDHMSMYGVNAGVPKTLVRYLVNWFAICATNEKERHALLDIIDTPISPELIPADSEGNIAQKTEDLVGPYELHDFFLYHILRFGRRPKSVFRLACQAFSGRYDRGIIIHWLRTFVRRFFNQQFKRSCMPDGPKIGSVALSPRGDWRMPSDVVSAMWLEEIDELN